MQFSSPFNWIDWLIMAISAYFAISGWEAGLLMVLAHFISYLASAWLALHFHIPVGNFVIEKFGLPTLWADVAGYTIITVFTSIIISEILKEGISRLPSRFHGHIVNNILGSVFSVLNGLLVMAILLVILSTLPLRGNIKDDIPRSVIGTQLIWVMDRFGGQIASEALKETQKFTTVDPSSKDSIALDITVDPNRLSIDAHDEQQMLELINNERIKKGVVPLSFNDALTQVARAHSQDMFLHKYFSHYDQAGHDVAWRLDQAKIAYTLAGENLAYAPDLMTAHAGLMQSPGHKKNILDPSFAKVGIGIIDSAVYGKMFTQVFSD